MSHTQANESAFPWVSSEGEPGMTMREWFAGMALQGLCAHDGPPYSEDEIAEIAVGMADALLAELRKEKP